MKDGKFHPDYHVDICRGCAKEKSMQVGSDLCDDCLFKQTMRKLREKQNEQVSRGS